MRQPHTTRNYNLTGINVPAACVPQQSSNFSLTAPPRTDLWRKSASEDDVKASILFSTLRFAFVSAEVTVSGTWDLEWDQAGLVLFVGDPVTTHTRHESPVNSHLDTFSNLVDQPPAYGQTALRWVKLGLEYGKDTLHASSALSTVHGTDWSSTALGTPLSFRGDLRVKMERVGQSLWLSYEEDDAQAPVLGSGEQPNSSLSATRRRWHKIRQVDGFFVGVEDKSVRVGVYASRPAGLHAINALNAERDLKVEFEDLVIF